MTSGSFLFSLTLVVTLLFGSCTAVPRGHFTSDDLDTPDYSSPLAWSALPDREDNADAIPLREWNDEQENSPVDVFFIHPTAYVGKRGQNQWNAHLQDQKLNKRVDTYPVKYQASIFNSAGKVYAPRYRQGHLNCFYTHKKEDAQLALQLAYNDVSKAFRYYLDHFNSGRPFILAAHSQGSMHAVRLLNEMIDGTPLQQKLVVAYLVGWPVPKDQFINIKPCLTAEETGCFCSWRTVREGYIPEHLHLPEKNILVTNPVSWTTGNTPTGKEDHKGAVLLDFNKLMPGLVTARVYEDFLWISKPKFPGSALLLRKNYHIADYNLFYADVRYNAEQRVKAYLGKPN